MIRRSALAAVLVLAVAGCTADRTPPAATAAPTTPAAEVPTPAPQDTETLYVESVHAEYPETRYAITDRELIDLGHDSCQSIGAVGALRTLTIAVGSAAGNADTERMFGYIIGAAVTAFCPEHRPELDALADAV